jgi:hypothetical protein
MNTKVLVPALLQLASLLVYSQLAMAAAPIRFLQSRHLSMPEAVISEQIQANFDVGSYREVRVQLIERNGTPDHLLVYLFSTKFHKFETVKVNIDADFRFRDKTPGYLLQAEDVAQQPGTAASGASCPDASTEFVAFAPNDNDLEQQITEKVAASAEAAHLKTVRLLKTAATRQAYLNYMSCPALKGNFYDGDSDPSSMVTNDGFINAADYSTILQGAFRHKVTNIWLACQAYNNPMLDAVQNVAQSQKYAAGVTDLEVGPSDNAGACAMQAAIAGDAMTAAFNDCYNKLDVKTDVWGFAGSGSDYFGQ